MGGDGFESHDVIHSPQSLNCALPFGGKGKMASSNSVMTTCKYHSLAEL